MGEMERGHVLKVQTKESQRDTKLTQGGGGGGGGGRLSPQAGTPTHPVIHSHHALQSPDLTDALRTSAINWLCLINKRVWVQSLTFDLGDPELGEESELFGTRWFVSLVKSSIRHPDRSLYGD